MTERAVESAAVTAALHALFLCCSLGAPCAVTAAEFARAEPGQQNTVRSETITRDTISGEYAMTTSETAVATTPPPEGQYVELNNGRRIHYLDHGEGPVVVFLHGSGAGASGHSNFKGNYPYFAQVGFRVIVPDLIGYGYSDKPDDVEYPLEFFAENVSLLIEHLGLDEVALVGNSLGGAIALYIALEKPALVSKMLLMAPGAIEDQPAYAAMPGMKIFFDTFAGEPSKEGLKRFLSEALVHNNSFVDDQLVDERWHVFQGQNPQAVKTMKVPNLSSRLGELEIPVLVMWGLNEKIMPSTGIETLAKGISDVRVVLVSNCGHWVMVEHRDYFNRITEDFLEN